MRGAEGEKARKRKKERRTVLKGKSFKLRERKKNAFLLMPGKYGRDRRLLSPAAG